MIRRGELPPPHVGGGRGRRARWDPVLVDAWIARKDAAHRFEGAAAFEERVQVGDAVGARRELQKLVSVVEALERHAS